MQGSTLSALTSLSTGSKYFNVTQNLISQDYVQTLNPACICLKVKIRFEALQPFCELQIFSDPTQVRTHP